MYIERFRRDPFLKTLKVAQQEAMHRKLGGDARPGKECHRTAGKNQKPAYEAADVPGTVNRDPRMLTELSGHHNTAFAAARSAFRPENRQPPRKVPSSER